MTEEGDRELSHQLRLRTIQKEQTLAYLSNLSKSIPICIVGLLEQDHYSMNLNKTQKENYKGESIRKYEEQYLTSEQNHLDNNSSGCLQVQSHLFFVRSKQKASAKVFPTVGSKLKCKINQQLHNSSFKINKLKHKVKNTQQMIDLLASNEPNQNERTRQSRNIFNSSHYQRDNGYNQLEDKMLIQYFYPKIEKIIGNPDQQAKIQKEQFLIPNQKVIFRKAKTEKYNFSKLYKDNHLKSYNTLKQCGRNAQFNNYDLIGCHQSLKSNRSNKENTSLPEKPHKQMSRFSEGILKQRVRHLEQQVFQKVPYLLKMGVNFRKLNARK